MSTGQAGNVDANIIAIRDIALVVGLHDTSPASLHQFYIHFSVGDTERTTSIVTKEEDQVYYWDENMFFDLEDHSVLNVEVYQKDDTAKDELVANHTDTVREMVEELQDGVFQKGMDTPEGSDLQNVTITFALGVESYEGTNVEELQVAYVVTRTTEVHTLVTTCGVLLRKMESLYNIVAGVPQIRLHASLALSVISAANQVIWTTCDGRAIRLASAMNDALTFIHDADPLKAAEPCIKIMTHLLQQVTECGYFITEYASRGIFWVRTAKCQHSDIDVIITKYEKKLRDLKAAFLEGVVLQTGITTVHMMNAVEDTAESIELCDIPYAFGARYAQEKGCLPGTRESVLRDIFNVLNNTSHGAPCMCLVTGVAGSGKSAIAHTIARLYDEQERLGSSFCFSRMNIIRRNAGNLFSTIARDLSDHNPQYKSALRDVMEDNVGFCTSTWPSEQFQNLIVRPCANLHFIGPIIIVIDAIDECGNPDDRCRLLDTLSRHIVERSFSANFRFLITTRPENNILDALPTGSHVARIHLGDVPEAVIDEDIGKLIRHSLDMYTELDSSWPNGEWCHLLVRQSQHLFQWASTACKFIREHRHVGLDPGKQLQILLESDDAGGTHPLDKLYQIVLKQHFRLCSAQIQFHNVMAVLLTLKEPMSLKSISALFGDDLRAQEVIKHLGSLLDGVYDDDEPIYPFHMSFYDFLLDETCSLAFHVHIQPHHSLTLGQASLACMQDMLKSKIYDCRNLLLHNVAITDLPHVVNEVVPAHLSYSCQCWMDHLQHADYTEELLTEITLFFRNFFPYWLEVIGFLSISSSTLSPILFAQQACAILMDWAKEQEIAALASQGLQFIQVFAPILRKSALVSALPATPSNSLLCPLWIDHLQKQFSTSSQHASSWPANQLEEAYTLKGHTDFVRSVGYSPNGQHIVSGSWDKTIRVWDVTTGECVAGPFHGQTFLVESIVYSPNGEHFAIGCSDKTIRVWDATTGQAVVDLFQGHTKPIKSVAYSPDGKNIVSGSMDMTIRVWDVNTAQCIAGPFKEHTDIVNSVGYSPDGKYIVSGSHDHTIRVWNPATGLCAASSFQGHTYPVTSVAYSPNGKHIVSGSQDTTIRVWDACTGYCMTGPFWGHTKSISSVAYSPTGKHILSGSQDLTIRVWDATTGQCVAGALQGHTHYITSIACSPDGKGIVSGSWDNTVRVWEVREILGSFKGHTDWVRSIGYSPDSRYIVSGSDDCTIRIWRASTGQCVAGPFQGHIDWVKSVCYSPNGKHVVSGSRDETLRVWDAITGQCVAGPFQGHKSDVNSVAYSPDGMHVVSGSDDGAIRVWNATTSHCFPSLCKEKLGSVWSVAYSPDGMHIVSGLGNGTIMVWNAVSGQCVIGPIQGHDRWINTVAYSPDGMHIVSGSDDHTLRVWNAVTGQVVIGPFQGHVGDVNSVAYSPNGMHIVSGSSDNTIRVWNATTGHCMAGPFEDHTGLVKSVAYSPDGMYIASGSADHTIKVWNTTTWQCIVGSDVDGL